jgi:hypothetical protein
MAKIKMIATKPHSFGMRTIEADEEFEVDNDQQAQTLISLGRATLKEGKSTKAKPTTTKSADEEEEPDNGKYKTRQMKAKGDK